MQTKVAVVGMGSLFPDARNTQELWQNILSRKVSIRPLPSDLLEHDVFYRPDLLASLNKQDKSTVNIAGWIQDLKFDTVRKYKIPPSVAEHMDANQHAALYAAGQALEMNPLKDVPKDRVAVVFGNGMVGTQYGDALARVQFQLVEHHLRRHEAFRKLPAGEQDAVVDYVRANVLKGSIPISEDSAPGILPNIIAGRIANVYDFHGPSYTVDAACASVLAAVMAGVQGLQLNQYDAVICGGADMPLKQLGFIMFSALNALSPTGSFPFDKRADGFVMGQGAGAITLKRLEDAIRSNDTIYAVITGYGETSDGKGKYIAAPNAEWQAHAIEKACRMAGYPVDTIEMVEAHGTATKVGDVVEVDGLKQAFTQLGVTRKNFCGLTSVKSNIGHLKSAAGIAGIIKAVLAIHHKILPPTASFEEINPKLELEGSPFYILDQARSWEGVRDYPRRANVSSFGFGGANYHVALEEYREEDYRKATFTGVSAVPARAVEQSATSTAAPPSVSGTQGAGLVYFSAGSHAELDDQIGQFLSAAADRSDMPFLEFCSLHNELARIEHPLRLAFQVRSREDLAAKRQFVVNSRGTFGADVLKAKGIFLKEGPPVRPDQIAILFPGQASQYVQMFRSLYDRFDGIRTLYRKADARWLSRRGRLVTSLLFPSGVSDEEGMETLRQTQHAHPAIFISSYALYEMLSAAGLTANTMIGHSLGEITALAASGRLSLGDALTVVEQRGYAFAEARLEDPGKMLSVMTSLEEAQALIRDSGINVVVANVNSPRQIIIAGGSRDIEAFQQFLAGKKIATKLLFVSHAFHTPLMKPVADSFWEGIRGIRFMASPCRVAMNHAGGYYPDDPDGLSSMPELLRDQILQPVNFVGSIEQAYRDGIRLFLEVGPGSILGSLVKDILGDRQASILSSNFRNTDDISGLERFCAALFAEGVLVNLPASRTGQAAVPGPAPVQSAPPAGSPAPPAVRVVYSGAAIGLPGSYKDTFRDDNFDQLFAGRNLIERLSDEERQKLVDLQITKLIKEESGPTFKLLTALDEVIQLAGKVGKIDMIRDYHIDEKTVLNMTSCIAQGVAAGYEALKDAKIPLIREYMRTSTGKVLPQKLALPPSMQDETGVIFANGFPLIDPVIEEVSRHVAYTYGSKTRKDLMAFYESIIGRLKDPEAKKLLTDWYTLYYSRLGDVPGHDEVYRFNHHFMTQISAQANNLLASLLNARGPNFQLNAACTSMSNAITIAEDFIRTGRVKRMIVVGADDPTSKTNLPLLGAGFLCTGAATNEGDLYAAAIPFDRRRNGMIVGAGAVGIILETQEEVARRGVAEICELLGTHSFNTAKHISQIDIDTFSRELENFIGRMEREYGLTREAIARESVYISHETFTPPRGGCAQTEGEALRRTFGDQFRNLIVGNTKGMTGHTMGASLEDAIAAKALQYGKCPPVVNLSQPDPMFEGLNLWTGGTHNRTLALKMSAGFGAQGHFALLRKGCSGDARIASSDKYTTWLKQVSGQSEPVLEQWGRVLILKDQPPSSAPAKSPGEKPARIIEVPPMEPARHPAQPVPAQAAKQSLDRKKIAKEVVELISRVTEYPPEMLEPEMELNADLGIADEKRTDIALNLAQRYALPRNSLTLTGDETVGQIVDRLLSVLSNGGGQPSPTSVISNDSVGATEKPAKELIIAETLKVFSEVTKYPQDMLELDMEMEADLGIDTVKQATILSILGEKYRMERQEGMQLSNYPTIRHIVELIYGRAGEHAMPPSTTEVGSQAAVAVVEVHDGAGSAPATIAAPVMTTGGGRATPPTPAGETDREAIIAETLRVFSEVTKYPEDMLELDMEMEADLGIDTVKQATILSILGEKYRMERQEGMQLSNYPTIRHIVELIWEQAGGASATERKQLETNGSSNRAPEAGGTEPLQPPDASEGTLTAEPVTPVSKSMTGTAAAVHDKQAIITDTLKVFSEVTKYPEDMLELDMEMEADLGIDTVKQATILSILGEKYRLERQEGMQLSNYPTIRHIVDLIYEQGGATGGAVPPEVSAPAEKAEPSTGAATQPEVTWQTSLSRQVPVLRRMPLGERTFALVGRTVWVLGDHEATVERMAAAVMAKGANVLSFTFAPTVSSAEVQKAFAAFAEGGAVDAVIDCSHVRVGPIPAERRFDQLSPEEADRAIFLSGEARFAVYKQLSSAHLRPSRVLCLTSNDGTFGVEPTASGVTDPTFGLLTGFYKALRKEWTNTEVRVLDLAPRKLADSFDAIAELALTELEHTSSGVEIAYPRGEREVVVLDDRDIEAGDQLTFGAGDTILVTGGGSGITSRVLLALARAYPANFIVVTLQPLPPNIGELAALDDAGLERVRNELHEQLKQKHKKVTPAMLSREFEKISRAIEVHKVLEEVRRLRRNLVYIPCDIRDHEALDAGLREARKSVGPITAIVHAAGIDQSHLLDQKSPEEFRSVVAVKARGAYNLSLLCREDPLRLVVAFSSISGRFGNAAQLDYSAANHFLNDWVRMMAAARPNAHAVCIAWSGWKDVGIAWRNEFVRRVSVEMGLNFIEVDQGVAAFMREIRFRTGEPEVILHNGLNGFVEPGLAVVDLSESPLLDRVVKRQGKIERAYRVFSIQRDALIDQHRLGKVPIMPAVGYAELAAEYYTLQTGKSKGYLFRNMTFPNAFKLFREQPRELYVEGHEHRGGWYVAVKSSFRPRTAAEAQIVLHSETTVTSEMPDLSGLDPETWTYHRAQPTPLPAEDSLLLIKSQGPEQRIILGPLYNDVLRESKSKEPVLIYPEGTRYPTYFPKEQLTNAKYPLRTVLVNPCFLDSIYQACAAHLLVNKQRVYLPWEIVELGIVDVPREEGLYVSHTRVVEETADIVSFDVVMVDGKGKIRYYARGARFRLINL